MGDDLNGSVNANGNTNDPVSSIDRPSTRIIRRYHHRMSKFSPTITTLAVSGSRGAATLQSRPSE